MTLVPWESAGCIIPNPHLMKMSNNDSDLSCDPANPRHTLVSGSAGVKLATEGSLEAGNQASTSVNATGNREFIQQVLHPNLLISRPRSASIGSTPHSTQNISVAKPTQMETTKSQPNPPKWQRVPSNQNKKRKKMCGTPSPERLLTTNRYSTLPIDLTTENFTREKSKQTAPIILRGVEDVNKLTELLETVTEKNQLTYKTTNRNQFNIN